MKLRTALAVVLLLPFFAATGAAPQRYLYKTSLIQAAPGQLLPLIELFKARLALDPKETGDARFFWMRHSQGDRWDLLVLAPVGTYGDYYQPARIARREKAEAALRWNERLPELVAWQEDVFVYGPPPDEVEKAFAGAALFHVEMFYSLAGRQRELYHEREMENAYARAVHQPENLIFTRDQGAAWDLFTIGGFRNLKHYAESEDLSQKDKDDAARAAGFENAAAIGPTLRKFIASHHDTLATAVK